MGLYIRQKYLNAHPRGEEIVFGFSYEDLIGGQGSVIWNIIMWGGLIRHILGDLVGYSVSNICGVLGRYVS